MPTIVFYTNTAIHLAFVQSYLAIGCDDDNS